MTYQTINEDRGEQRAADLRNRFRQITDTSLGRRQFGIWPSSAEPVGRSSTKRWKHFSEFAVWLAMAIVVLSVGLAIF
ncbi:MAG: hypothetical protein ABJY83_22235 [Roseibium sp.]